MADDGGRGDEWRGAAWGGQLAITKRIPDGLGRLWQRSADGSAWLDRPVKTGGGGKFLSFLKQELIPLIDQTYRADPNGRVLVGHSYGGLFALYALFERDEGQEKEAESALL
jgi:pimeloyl-ACP methyl ester carboxylesterase